MDYNALLFAITIFLALEVMGHALKKEGVRPVVSYSNPLEAPRTIFLFIKLLFKRNG